MANIVQQHESEKKAPAKAGQLQKSEDVSLKGTFVSVMILGGFLALSWLLVFILFLARN